MAAIAVLLSMPAACAAAPMIEATVFEPGAIADGGVFGLTLSPQGTHALRVKSGSKREPLASIESVKTGGQWQARPIAPYCGNPAWKDTDPAFSPDGTQPIFQSTRPVQGKPEREGFDIWSVRPLPPAGASTSTWATSSTPTNRHPRPRWPPTASSHCTRRRSAGPTCGSHVNHFGATWPVVACLFCMRGVGGAELITS